MEYLKSYKVFEEVNDIDIGFNLTNFLDQAPTAPTDPKYDNLIEITKRGNLYKYLVTGERKLTFGMLKDLHKDALKFKKNREIKQGIEKFLWRIIPIAFAPIFLPIWIIAQILGATRALNKVMIQVLKMDNGTYDTFLMNIVRKVNEYKIIDLTEGELQRLYVDDWFYKSFAISKGLKEMIKKELFIEFSFYIVKKIQYQNDDKIVPDYYIENEFRRWLNRKFRMNPPLPLKRKRDKHEKF